MRKFWMFMLVSMCVVLFASTGFAAEFSGKKVLFIDSYHEGYPWSDGTAAGVQTGLKDSGAELKFFRMDTKRNTSDEFAKQAGVKAKAFIDEYKPDVVIASDDPAAKFIIVPFYKDAALPFVFCGVNWDAGIYGFPFKNTTGMVEVSPTPALMEQISPLAKGGRVGYLASDDMTAKKEGEYYKKLFKLELTEVYAKDFEAWKKAFVEIQGKVDILLVGNQAAITDWKADEAEKFVLDNTKIPTGTVYDFLAPYTMLTFAKVAEEQGFWSAKAALQILKGAQPASIPIAQNKEGQLIINAKIAQKVGVNLPYTLLQTANKIIE